MLTRQILYTWSKYVFLFMFHKSCVAFAPSVRTSLPRFYCPILVDTESAKLSGPCGVEHPRRTFPSRGFLIRPLVQRAEREGFSRSEDPFRPVRASISPVVINALVKVLFHNVEAESAVAWSLEQRAAREDWQLSQDEEQVVMARVYGVSKNVEELRSTLATAINRTPFIAKYGMEADYGVSSNLESDPLTQINHVECLLALHILCNEDQPANPAERPGTIDFIDTDKLDVLQQAAASSLR